MNGRTPTAKEKKWLNITKQIGCIVCILKGTIRPFQVDGAYTANHHINGCRKPDAHLNSIPLCDGHHQVGEYARHRNKKRFEAEYGTEAELLEATEKLVNATDV